MRNAIPREAQRCLHCCVAIDGLRLIVVVGVDRFDTKLGGETGNLVAGAAVEHEQPATQIRELAPQLHQAVRR